MATLGFGRVSKLTLRELSRAKSLSASPGRRFFASLFFTSLLSTSPPSNQGKIVQRPSFAPIAVSISTIVVFAFRLNEPCHAPANPCLYYFTVGQCAADCHHGRVVSVWF